MSVARFLPSARCCSPPKWRVRCVNRATQSPTIRSVPQMAWDSTQGPARRPLPPARHRAIRGRPRGHRNGGKRADGLPARMHDRRAVRDRRAAAERDRGRASLPARRAQEGRLRRAPTSEATGKFTCATAARPAAGPSGAFRPAEVHGDSWAASRPDTTSQPQTASQHKPASPARSCPSSRASRRNARC